jgi:glycosyltransferase involved in cell wall biosynthesis
MHIALFFWDRLPVLNYGGTQRMVVYLARGLAAAGHRVTLLAGPGSDVPEATLVPVDLAAARTPEFDVRPHLPTGLDILLSFVPLRRPPDVPWIRCLPGNWKAGMTGAPNTLYLSRDHARRHGGEAFVYNGLDPSEFELRRGKADYDLFLGRLHRVKGYRWAIEGARRAGRRLVVAGGWRPSLRRSIRYVGQVGGARKAELLAGARCLWMPALWDEPFGITLIEALASGTPVLGTRRGALPEIVSPKIGALGDSVDELVALRPALDAVDPDTCRAHVERHFTHHVMAAEYVRMFRGFLATGVLPAGRTTDEALLHERESP